jgi:hypothetical protein
MLLRASRIVLILSLALWILGIFIARTGSINWRQWTFVNDTRERTFAINSFGIWFMSFHDSSGQHQIFANRPVHKAWDENSVHSDTSIDFHFLKLMLFKAKFTGAGWSGSLWSVGVPYYLFVIPSAILPIRYRNRRVWRWIAGMKLKRLRRQRLSLGHCGGCGYDLRATHHQCPECGRIVRLVPTSLPPRPKRRILVKA